MLSERFTGPLVIWSSVHRDSCFYDSKIFTFSVVLLKALLPTIGCNVVNISKLILRHMMSTSK